MRKNVTQLCMFAMSLLVAIATSQTIANAATIDKTTVIIRANTTFLWDKTASATKYGWLPELDFRVNGPIPSGSLVSFEMTTPDGRSWVSADCETTRKDSGEILKVEGCGRDLKKERYTSALGVYGLKINLKNELQGNNQNLFTGKFKVGKVFYGDVTQDKDNYRWYVDYDWALPIAEIYADAIEESYGGPREREAQPLVATFWFRGEATNCVAYLFYNGNEIANTETTTQGTVNGEQGVSLFEKPGYTQAWVKNRYTFSRVLVVNKEKYGSHSDVFRMDKNPGEYQIKVLRKGKLVRSAKFTIDANGRIVDPGVSRQNELGTQRITLFATVTGDEDGRKPDLEAWKAMAFFGEPLKGFGN